MISRVLKFKRRGVNLTEAAMVLVIGAVIVATVAISLGNANEARKNNLLVSQINQIRLAVAQVKGTKRDYAFINGPPNWADETKFYPHLPKSWFVEATTGVYQIKHAFGGDIIIAGRESTGHVAGTQTFFIQIFNIPSSTCEFLLTQDFGTEQIRNEPSNMPTTPCQGAFSYLIAFR